MIAGALTAARTTPVRASVITVNAELRHRDVTTGAFAPRSHFQAIVAAQTPHDATAQSATS
jgi:hypothetical protein